MSEKENKPFEGGEISRVGVRMPPFYPDKPALWFAQLESQFVLANITVDSTKYHYAMGQLDPVYASEVEDIITAPTAPDKYERLKAELIKRLSASREKKVKQLLTDEELGDRKPSQFLRHLKHLAGPGIPDEFLKTIWTSRLPSSTQSIIASQLNATLDDVAELADRIHDVVTPSLQVAAASSTGGYCGVSGEIAELTRQVQALTSKVERMSREKGRSRAPNRSRGRSTQRSHSNFRKFPTCWFHHKFGDKANKCVKPCDFAGNDGGSR